MIEPIFLVQSFTVVTYGGGEILQKIFQAISMLFNNGNGGLIRPIMIMCASVGGIYAYSRAFFASASESLLLRYFFPLIIITTILMIPSTTVHIEDVLNANRIEGQTQTKSYSVSHVPWLLAKFAETTSTIGYQIAQGIESVMHMPNDANYNSTGMIFGSESSLDISKYRLTNANLEQNMRMFAKQCVLYDIALNKYALDDIKKATDLWDFFERKTSNVRMFRYCPPDSKNFNQCSYLTCKNAVEKMKPFLEKEKEYYAKLEIGKNLPLTIQALTGIQRETKELVGQQLAMNVLSDELSGGQFAKYRASVQQQSTYRTMGSLAATGLVTMRIVFEGLIYSVFIFIVPLSLTPNGTKYLINWAWLVIWIQMWPPLFSILNYIMQIAAHYKFNGWISSLSEDLKGLSFFTSIGMQNLNDEIFALASFLAVSVPYISYILLKDGLSSFVQLASSLMAPAQNAASSAAAEQVSGNYSFANASMGQLSFNNTSALQTTMSPSISSGYFTDNQGEISTIYGGETPIVRQSTSELRTSFFSDDVIGKNLQKQYQEAQSTMENTQETFANNISYSARLMSDYMTHLGGSNNYSENYSEREGYGIQESVNFILNTAETWGKQFGLNAKESSDVLLGAAFSGGFDWKMISAKANLGGNIGNSVSRDELLNSALNVSKSEGFQQNLQKIHDYASTRAFNSNHDEGYRWNDSMSNMLDQLSSTNKSYQEACNNLHQSSENLSWFEQNSQMIKHSLNQDFIRWASQEYDCNGGFEKIKEILSNDTPCEVKPLVERFVSHLRSESSLIIPKASSSESLISNIESERQSVKDDVFQHSDEVLKNIGKGASKKTYNHLYEEILSGNLSEIVQEHDSKLGLVKDKLENSLGETRDNFESKNSQYLLERHLNRLNKYKNLGGASQINEAPFWSEEGNQ